FNAAISGHRVYATASLPLPEVKALAKSRGVTINDVVLALCAGALRRYLAGRAALPEKALTAGVPASIRPLGDAKLNTQVFFTLSRLPTDVAEPLPRLAAAQTAGQGAKNLFSDMRDLVTTDISILGAPLVVTGLARLWAEARAYNVRPFFNVIVSNVPGPRQTMYCVGAPATHYFPVSIPYHGCALNMTVHSYLDQLDFGLVACSETVPDAQRIADYIAEDFAAMRKADAELNRPEAIETIAAAPAAPPALHQPITLGEAETEPRWQKVEETSGLTQQIDALGEATEALLRRLRTAHAAAPKARAAKPKTETKRKPAASKASAAKRARLEDAPARPKRTRAGEAVAPARGRKRHKRPAPATSGP